MTDLEQIKEILDNLQYWDTCPQEYKDKIPALLESLSLHSVSGSCEWVKDDDELKSSCGWWLDSDDCDDYVYCPKCGKKINYR